MYNLVPFVYSIIFFASIMMILSNNAVYSVFFLIIIYINVSIILILLSSDFLGILLFLVYVGAIAILFLFIIMMVDIKKLYKSTDINISVGICIIALFFIFIIGFFYRNLVFFVPENIYAGVSAYEFVNFDIQVDEYNNVDSVRKIGYFLFNEYYLFVLFSGLLLLVSIIGAIHLTNIKRGYTYKAQYNQLYSTSMLLNSHIA